MANPDDCPFHELDPDVTVWANGMPYSAQLCCESWHDTRGIAEVLRREIDAALTVFDRLRP